MAREQTTGRLVAGRYLLASPIGKGGMGIVWRARDTLLERDVAVKEIQLPAGLADADRDVTRIRVMREARAAARISHPSAVMVFDVVEEDGCPHIIMELVEAPTLDDEVESNGPLSPEMVAQIGTELLGALEAAHARGIVHRDVKPGNVMLSPSGPAKLADFGIASVKGDQKITATGLILGSPSYMAPEQASQDTSGPASDLWSLGATMYYGVEGQPPFDKGSAIPTLTAVLGEDPRPPQRAQALEPVLRALLAKDPARRPAGAELRRMLDDVRYGTAVAAPGPVPAQARAEDSGPEAAPYAVDDVRPTALQAEGDVDEPAGRGSRTGLLWLAAALAVVVAIALFVALGDDGTEQGSPREAQRQEQRKEKPRADGGDGANAPAEAPVVEDDAGDIAGEDNVAAEGWTAYQDTETGYSLAYPPGWQVVRQDGTRTDFRDPASGTYLRVDWRTPPADDPVEAWESFSQDFAARHEGYEEIRIEPTTYKGYEAAIWEFTYRDGAVQLHAVDLGFIAGDYGFALNFQTREEDWLESQDTFEAFKASFEAPA